MKKIFLLLLIISSFANAQMDTNSLYRYPMIYSGYRAKSMYLDSFLRAYFPQSSIDTSTKKVLVTDVYGNVTKMYWPASGATSITADNGLTASTSTNVQLGGQLINATTTIDANANELLISGANHISLESSITNGYNEILANGQDGGNYLNADGTNGVNVISANSFTGTNTISAGASNSLLAQSNLIQGSTLALEARRTSSTTNTVIPISIMSRQTTGTGANGIGGSLDFYINTSTTNQLSNQLISKWTDATDATRTSQFIITGVNSGTTGDILTLNGNKSIQLNGYGSGTFTGTPAYSLSVDASGNIIETTATSGVILPTGSGSSNISSSTISQGTYSRVGNNVTYSFSFTVGVTTANSAAQISFTLPIASNFVDGNEAWGVFTTSTNNASGSIVCDTTNDKVILQFQSATTSSVTGTVMIQYTVK